MRQGWRGRNRALGYAVASLALLASCGAGAGTGPVADGTTRPATGTAASRRGSAPADAAPHLLVTGDDPEAVIRSMLAFQDWSLRRPDPRLPERWITPGSPCLELQRETHRYLREHHRRAEVSRVVESVRVVDRPDRHHALLEVRERSRGARVRADGDPASEVVAPPPPGRAVYALTRDPTTMEWRMSRAGCGS